MKVSPIIICLMSFYITIGQNTTKSTCSDPLAVKVDLELLQKATKVIKTNIEIFKKDNPNERRIVLKKIDIQKYLQLKSFDKCGYFTRHDDLKKEK